MIQKVMKLFLLLGVLSFTSMQAQTVTGTITDATDGSPLPGVNVIIKGTGTGVSSDFDGNYSIDVKSDTAVLLFSYMGYTTQEIVVNGKNRINVALAQSAESLDEVVVTALGIKREVKKLGYAMSEVKGDEIVKTNTINPVLALQGKSAGLSIGASDGGLFGNSKIQIRGVSTLNSKNNQPIFVIDGVILENDISNESADWNSSANDYGNMLKNLNPDDYKSVSVLKGAAATALYGSRGINGAIIIQSKDGANARGLGISIKQSVGIETVYKQPGIQYEFGEGKMAGWVTYGEKDADGNYYKFDTEQHFTNEDGVATMIGTPWGGWMGNGPKFDGRPMIGFDGEMTTYSPIKNHMKDAYDTGYNTNTSVALSGGNEKGDFYLSDSYNERTGVMPNNKFSRNSLLLSGSYKLADWLKAKASISYTSSRSKNPTNYLSENFLGNGWTTTYDTNKYKQNQYWQASHGGVPSSNYGDAYTNVPGKGTWYGYYNNNNINEEQVVRPIVRLTANVTDWLTMSAEASMNQYSTKFEAKHLGGGFANEGGYYQIKHKTNDSKTGKFTMNFNKDISEDFSSQLLVGAEIWSQEKSETKVETDGGLVVPGRFFLGNSKKTLKSSGSISGTKQINSVYFMGSFGYKDQVYLDVTGRNDWSSALVYTNGEGNYSYFYPSVSTSWLVNETFELPNWVSFGKVRASWAQVGNDTSPYDINRGYGLGTYEMEGGQFVYTNGVNTTVVDKSIKPERKNSFEVGADMRFFGSRLGFDLAYYDETIEDQIGSVPLPIESGYSNLYTNIGTLTNRGFELSLTGKPIQTEDFTWETTFNYWKNTTKVKEMHEDYGEFKRLGGDISYGNFRVGSVAFEGGEYGVLMSDIKPLEWESEDPNDPRNGMPVLKWVDSQRGAFPERSLEVQKVGKMQPDFEASMANTFTYKDFSLSVLIDGRFGGHIASYSNRYGHAYGWLESSLEGRSADHGGITWTSGFDNKQYSDGVIPEGVFKEGQVIAGPNGNVNVGGLTYQEAFDQGLVEPTHASYYNYRTNSWGNGVINDSWFNEVNYIALRNISVGYNLPKTLSDKIGAKNLYVSLNARNLGYLYNSLPNDLHPESFRGTSSSDSFRERSFSPYVANYTFTVAVDF